MTLLASVLTTIQEPTRQVIHLAELTEKLGGSTFVVGDKKTPQDWTNKSTKYLSFQDQINHPIFKGFAGVLPANHYARKNLGYLFAMQENPEWIYETDDDNLVDFSSFKTPKLCVEDSDLIIKGGNWVNVYKLAEEFQAARSKSTIWPRGFPLELINVDGKNWVSQNSNLYRFFTPIASGLVNGDPDVDAIFRLTNQLPFSFSPLKRDVVLSHGSWCPFNSQNTWWHRSVFPLLYLPITTTFRVTDILRSYVALAIAEKFHWGIRFFGPSAHQDRNQHDLISDFEDEILLYLSAQRLLECIRQSIKSASNEIDAIWLSYNGLLEREFVQDKEMQSLEFWLDLSSRS